MHYSNPKINRESKIQERRLQSRRSLCFNILFIGLIIMLILTGIGTYKTIQTIYSIRGTIPQLKEVNELLTKETIKMKADNDFIKTAATEIANDYNQFMNNPKANKLLLSEIFFPYRSNILLSLTELTLIKRWIQTEEQFYMRMIYKATLHGDKPEDFHSFCDEAESSLILIKDSEGNRFGGFTSRTWEYSKFSGGSAELTKEDSKAFVFNLNEQKKHKVSRVQHAIECDPHFGPFFGNEGDIIVNANFLTNPSSSNFPESFGSHNIEKYSLTKGKSEFQIVELEVFEIDFEY